LSDEAKQAGRVDSRRLHHSVIGLPEKLVGREEEFALLNNAVDAALKSEGHTLTITGESGIGKTELLESLEHIAVNAEMDVFRTVCSSLPGSPPLWPWRELLTRQSKFDDVTSLMVSPHGGVTDSASESGIDSQKFELFSALADALHNVARSKPVFVAIDDLQWADSTSQELFVHLSNKVDRSKIVLAATIRTSEDEMNSDLRALLSNTGRARSSVRIEPRFLKHDEIHKLVESLVGHSVTEGVVAEIFTRSNGVPLFVRELARNVDERGQILKGNLPTTISESLGARIDQLSSTARETVQIASILGTHFRIADILEIVKRTDTKSITENQSAAVDAIDDAAKQGVVKSSTSSSGEFEFSHPMFSEVIRDQTPAGTRATLHSATAELLEDKYGEKVGEHSAELAWHFKQASSVISTTRLVEYSLLAGRQSLSAFAWGEALEHFETARSVAAHDPESVELAHAWMGIARARQNSHQSKWGNPLAAKDIEAGLATAFNIFLKNGEVDLAIDAAAQGIVGELGWTPALDTIERALDIADQDSARSARLLTRYGDVLFNDPERSDECWDVFEQALDMAIKHDDRNLQLTNLRIQAQFKRQLNRYEEVLDIRQRALPLMNSLPPNSDAALIHIHSGVSICALGKLDEGEQEQRKGFEIGSQLGVEYALYHMNVINIGLARADFAAAIANAREVQRISENVMAIRYFELLEEAYTGDMNAALSECTKIVGEADSHPHKPTVQALFGTLCAWIARHLGNSEVLERLLEVRKSLLSNNPNGLLTDTLLRNFEVELAITTGDIDLARPALERIQLSQGAFDMDFGGTPIDIDRGELLKICGENELALEAFKNGLEHSKRAGNVIGECKSALTYARGLSEKKTRVDSALAVEVLTRGITTAEAHDLKYLRETMITLRDKLTAGKPSYPAGLTEREHEITQLLIAGKSNPQISEELFISLNTVLRHVSNIFSKLDVSSRTEAAIKAVELGLGDKTS